MMCLFSALQFFFLFHSKSCYWHLTAITWLNVPKRENLHECYRKLRGCSQMTFTFFRIFWVHKLSKLVDSPPLDVKNAMPPSPLMKFLFYKIVHQHWVFVISSNFLNKWTLNYKIPIVEFPCIARNFANFLIGENEIYCFYQLTSKTLEHRHFQKWTAFMNSP